MKNQREIYEALLAGETLINAESGGMVKFNNEGQLIWVSKGQTANVMFLSLENWQIYKEPKWYENIPDGGVLCWTSDDNPERKQVMEIIRHDSNEYRYQFIDVVGTAWKNATPLTKQEIQVFMDNVPEDL